MISFFKQSLICQFTAVFLLGKFCLAQDHLGQRDHGILLAGLLISCLS